MGLKNIKARAEIPEREWIEFEVQLQDDTIKEIKWHAQGCHLLIDAAEKAVAGLKNKKLMDYKITDSRNHGELLIAEVIDKLSGRFKTTEDEEICHCRVIKKSVIDQSIVLGAHTPEIVRAWTTASSGCGTCRPEVQKLIDSRLKKSAA